MKPPIKKLREDVVKAAQSVKRAVDSCGGSWQNAYDEYYWRFLRLDRLCAALAEREGGKK